MKTITTTIKWRNAAEELPKESCQERAALRMVR